AIESLTMSAEDGALEASIRSFSAAPAERTVEVSLNGTVLERSTVEVPAGGRAAVKVTAPELAAGGNRIVARLVQGDGLTVDDERFLALRRPEPRSALIVAADTEDRKSTRLNSSHVKNSNALLRLKQKKKK